LVKCKEKIYKSFNLLFEKKEQLAKLNYTYFSNNKNNLMNNNLYNNNLNGSKTLSNINTNLESDSLHHIMLKIIIDGKKMLNPLIPLFEHSIYAFIAESGLVIGGSTKKINYILKEIERSYNQYTFKLELYHFAEDIYLDVIRDYDYNFQNKILESNMSEKITKFRKFREVNNI